MKLTTFKTLILQIEAIDKRRHALHRLGVDLLDYDDPHFKVINVLMEEAFGKEGSDWISWFMYEKDFGKRKDLKAWDDGKEICRNVKELFEYVEGLQG